MRILELSQGDTAVIEGTRATAVTVFDGYPEDENRGTIRIDGAIRKNAGVGLDEKVSIRKVVPKPATKVDARADPAAQALGGEEYLVQALEGRPIMKGDLIEVNIMGRKFDLVVQSIQPSAEAAVIQNFTKIKLSEKPAKDEVAKGPKVAYEDIGGLHGRGGQGQGDDRAARSGTPSCSRSSASMRPRAFCCTGRQALARRSWPRPSPPRRAPTSSP